MPEVEDLLIDAARHATIAAQGMWCRLRSDRDDVAPRWRLEDCRLRVALLVEAVLGLRLAVRNAQPPAPVSWASRTLRHTPRRAPVALPANDGLAIYLPPSLDTVAGARGAAEQDIYPLLALLQAVRVARGSAACYARCATPLAADLFLLAEAAAAADELRRLLPGWYATLDALHARSAAALAQMRPHNATQHEVLALYRAVLQDRHAQSVPAARTAQISLEWANGFARLLAGRQPRERYLQWLEDLVIGRLLPPEAAPSALPRPAAHGDAHGQARRAMLARRPRARKSAEGEDDSQPGAWMVQTTEPQEHAEDPFGLNRPQDREAENDVEGVAQSLAELESARLVSTPGRAAEVMCSDDPPPRLEHGADSDGGATAFAYPEWDCRKSAYGLPAHVHVAPAATGPAEWVESALRRHGGTLRALRRRLGIIRPHRQTLRRQPEGDDIDCDALVDERSERRAGGSPSGAVYLQHRRAPRRIGLLLLIDASASTDAWVADGRRVIDVEKDAALVAACALEAAGAEFAVLSFSGEGRRGVQVRSIKDFGQPWNADAMRRVGALEPERYTRLGGVVRHACALLARRAVDFRLLLLFSDGKPNDCDLYAGNYGLEDARQALIEARAQRIDPYCFTVDREGSAYLPHLFGAGRYTIVQRAQQLPQAFVDWLRNAARRAGN